MDTVIASRSRHQVLRGLPAVTDQAEGDDQSTLSRHEIRAGCTVFADPRCRKQFRGTEVVEFDWEGRRFWATREEFEASTRRVD
jgi:hypothetical protein